MTTVFGTWTIRKRLLAGFVAVGGLVGLVGTLATQRVNRIGTALREIVAVSREVDQQGRLRTGLLQQIEAEKNFLLAGEPKYIELHRKLRRDNDVLIQATLAEARAQGDTAKAAGLETLAEAYKDYLSSFDEVL
jgi:CHASE3 domain sensor protein